ncbi:MAG: isoaspartyl peptidase/L-asparaginase [Micrococcales bacterium]|nr:isoaspartyl peptidase/L-asparaginase [Micrococcales bacterium]
MTAVPIHMTTVPPFAPFSLAIHGGAGPLRDNPERSAAQAEGLRRALAAGDAVLATGGAALDAVCAAVMVLEDDESFNAGRGAALTVAGTAELDACVCDGVTGMAGAVAASRRARHPVLAARAVMERTPHVLLADPSPAWLDEVGLEQADPDWFVTPARLAALRGHAAETTAPLLGHTSPPAAGQVTPPVTGHGTVGAVARDAAGRLAAATSTGGVTGQWVGRVGDTPVVGAGTWADERVAVSGTGIGEFFLRSAFAHDIAARMRWTGAAVADAMRDAIADNLLTPKGDGGAIAVDAHGTLVLAYCSQSMLRGHLGPDGPVVVA